MPRAWGLAASARRATGELLVMSIHTAEAGMAARRPPGLAITSRTSRDPGSIVMTRSAPSATSAGLLRHRAPHSSTAASSCGRASAAVTSYPAATRFTHIGRPIRPVPTNPIALMRAR
jgi:hypothetical protein